MPDMFDDSDQPRSTSPESLADYLGDGPASPLPTIRLLRRILEVLKDAHLSGAQHQPLSPETIRLDVSGNPVIAPLEEPRSSDQTVIFKYPKYSAPEAFGGSEQSSNSCEARDCYVLGFLFYELLLGKKHFSEQFAAVEKPPASAWFKWHGSKSAKAIPVQTILPGVSATVSNLIGGMMEKGLDKRVKTIQQALDLLPDDDPTVLTRPAFHEAKAEPIPDPDDTARMNKSGAFPPKSRTELTAPAPTNRQNSRTIALVLLALVGLVALLFGWFFRHSSGNSQPPIVVKKSPIPAVARPNAQVSVPAESLPASSELQFRVVSSLNSATLTLDGKDLGNVTVGTPFVGNFSAGPHSLKVSSDQDSSLDVEFLAQPDGTFALTEPPQATALRTIVSVLNGDTVRLYASPAARASVGQLNLKRIPRNGLSAGRDALLNVRFDKEPQNEISLSAAKSTRLTIFVSDDPDLVPIGVHVNIPGSTVSVDGETLRRQPDANGSVVFRLPAGTYRLRVSHPDYQDSEEQKMVVVRNQPQQLAVTLTPLAPDADLQIDGAPAGTEVLLDQKALGVVVAGHVFKSKVSPGKHIVTLHRDNFDDLVVTENFSAGADIHVGWQPLRPLGTMTFAGAPSDAKITLTSESDSRVHNCANGQPCNLPAGNYALTIRASGFRAVSNKLVVDPGDNRSYPFQLETALPKMVAKSSVTPRDLFADGQNWAVDKDNWWTHAEPGYSFLRSGQGSYIFDIQKPVGPLGFKRVTFVADFTSASHDVVYTLDGRNLRRKVNSPGLEIADRVVAHEIPASEVFRLKIDLRPDRIVIRNGAGKLLDDLTLSSFGEGRFGFSGNVRLRVYQLNDRE